jgi:hypothetical protein
MPSGNLHLGKIKKAIGKLLWCIYLYKIDRRQLVMRYLKGGLALTNVKAENEVAFFEGKSV